MGPADAGDSLNTPVKTCFTGWGNSCLVEWPWHANRDTQAKQTVWHNYTGKCYENMFFGDGHMENFKFPPQMDQWVGGVPDMGFTWW
jgi:hypothetical protein